MGEGAVCLVTGFRLNAIPTTMMTKKAVTQIPATAPALTLDIFCYWDEKKKDVVFKENEFIMD